MVRDHVALKFLNLIQEWRTKTFAPSSESRNIIWKAAASAFAWYTGAL